MQCLETAAGTYLRTNERVNNQERILDPSSGIPIHADVAIVPKRLSHIFLLVLKRLGGLRRLLHVLLLNYTNNLRESE